MRFLLNQGSAALFAIVGVGGLYLMLISLYPPKEAGETDKAASGLTVVDPRPYSQAEIATLEMKANQLDELQRRYDELAARCQVAHD